MKQNEFNYFNDIFMNSDNEKIVKKSLDMWSIEVIILKKDLIDKNIDNGLTNGLINVFL